MIYRTEHPKPQFMRENWLNLNGSWDFEVNIKMIFKVQIKKFNFLLGIS